MTQGKAQDIVNGAALVVAGIYFYRRLIEPGGSDAAASSAGTGASPSGEFDGGGQLIRFRGPFGSYASPGEPATIGGAAAQLFGEGKPASTERFVTGWGFVFLSLSLAVPAAPQLAGSFAALVALGSVLGNGRQVAKDIEAQLHHKAEPESSAVSSPPTTLVSFAGHGAAATAPAVFPQSTPPKKKNRKRSQFKVEST